MRRDARPVGRFPREIGRAGCHSLDGPSGKAKQAEHGLMGGALADLSAPSASRLALELSEGPRGFRVAVLQAMVPASDPSQRQDFRPGRCLPAWGWPRSLATVCSTRENRLRGRPATELSRKSPASVDRCRHYPRARLPRQGIPIAERQFDGVSTYPPGEPLKKTGGREGLRAW